MMTGTLGMMPFQYQQKPVRVVMQDAAPWWIAKDVCEILEISKYRDALARMDDDERGSVIVDTPGGKQTMGAINESGLYHLIFQSHKPEARAFRKWITAEVIPSIRKTGGYALRRPERPAAHRPVRATRRTAISASPRKLQATPDGYLSLCYAATLEGISNAAMSKRVKRGWYDGQTRRVSIGDVRSRTEIQVNALSAQARQLLVSMTKTLSGTETLTGAQESNE